MNSHKTGNKCHFGYNVFWYHCKEHTFSFNLISKSSSYASYILRYDSFSESVILRNRPLKFPIPIVLDLTGCKNAAFFFFVGKCLKIGQKLHRGDRKHKKYVKKKKSQNRQMNYFLPCAITLIVHISK